MSLLSSTLTRTLSAILATLLFWTPLATTVARAQDAADEPGAASEPIHPALLQAMKEWTRQYLIHAGNEGGEAGGQGYEPKVDPVKPVPAEPAPQKESAPQTEPDPEPTEPLNLPSGRAKTAVTPEQIALPVHRVIFSVSSRDRGGSHCRSGP
jgi:hypothetical protein